MLSLLQEPKGKQVTIFIRFEEIKGKVHCKVYSRGLNGSDNIVFTTSVNFHTSALKLSGMIYFFCILAYKQDSDTIIMLDIDINGFFEEQRILFQAINFISLFALVVDHNRVYPFEEIFKYNYKTYMTKDDKLLDDFYDLLYEGFQIIFDKFIELNPENLNLTSNFPIKEFFDFANDSLFEENLSKDMAEIFWLNECFGKLISDEFKRYDFSKTKIQILDDYNKYYKGKLSYNIDGNIPKSLIDCVPDGGNFTFKNTPCAYSLCNVNLLQEELGDITTFGYLSNEDGSLYKIVKIGNKSQLKYMLCYDDTVYLQNLSFIDLDIQKLEKFNEFIYFCQMANPAWGGIEGSLEDFRELLNLPNISKLVSKNIHNTNLNNLGLSNYLVDNNYDYVKNIHTKDEKYGRHYYINGISQVGIGDSLEYLAFYKSIDEIYLKDFISFLVKILLIIPTKIISFDYKNFKLKYNYGSYSNVEMCLVSQFINSYFLKYEDSSFWGETLTGPYLLRYYYGEKKSKFFTFSQVDFGSDLEISFEEGGLRLSCSNGYEITVPIKVFENLYVAYSNVFNNYFPMYDFKELNIIKMIALYLLPYFIKAHKITLREDKLIKSNGSIYSLKNILNKSLVEYLKLLEGDDLIGSCALLDGSNSPKIY